MPSVPCYASCHTPCPKVRFTGRFDFSQPDGPIFAWSGSAMSVRFEGDALSVRLRPVHPQRTNNWMAVIVDGVEGSPIQVDGDREYSLASGLSTGVHQVDIVKRTEAMEGELQLLGFVLPEGGSMLEPPSPSARRIEFVGDSITCGYGNEAAGIEGGYKPAQENFLKSHAYLTARALGAECITVAWSGKGVYSNYGGAMEGERMPQLYPRILPFKADSRWDFGCWLPQVVVINLGTNDFSVPIDDDGFRHAYVGLIGTVRDRYPDAHIICAMLDDRAVAAVKAVVESVNASADQMIGFVQYTQDIERDGIGGDWHPSAKTHAMMAGMLVEAIKDRTGWK